MFSEPILFCKTIYNMEKDWNKIAQLEKAISARYGEEAIQNPKKEWDSSKEDDYLEQVKGYTKKMRAIHEQEEKVEVKGFFMSKKLLNREIRNNCPNCQNRLRTVRDDIYMNKYECCEKCYINYVEDREEQWLSARRLGENKCHK